MRYIPLALLWVLYCAIHSWMISPPVTRFAARKLGHRFRFYRLFFNVVALSTLVPLLIYSSTLKTAPLFEWEGGLRVLRILVVATGLFLFITGARHYSFARFLGIQQIREGASRVAMSGDDEILATGIHGIIRHPWYVAVFLLIWAHSLDVSAIVVNVVLTVYLAVGTILEERKLVDELGEKYRDYQKNVSMFFPFKWLKHRLSAHPHAT